MIRTVRLVLDIAKTAAEVAGAKRTPDIVLRQGEQDSTAISAEIRADSAALDLTGCEVYIKLLRADSKAVIGTAKIETAAEGRVSYVLPAEAAAIPCAAALMYFEVHGPDGISSTKPVGFAVGPGVDLTAEQAEAYVEEFERLKGEFRALIAAADAQKAAQQTGWQEQTDAQQAAFTASQDGRDAAYEAAEQSRDASYTSAEQARQGAFETTEASRAKAEAARVAADAARTTAQAKNNADQALNNAAMQKLTPYICGPGEYDADTLMPTVTGEPNRMYYVPSEQGPANRYVEWMLIEGAWELMGVSQVEVSPISTSQIDAVAAGSAPTGEDTLNLTGLSYLWAKIKAAFAPLSHKHPGSDINDNSIAGAKLASGSVTDAKVSANAAISGSKLADKSVTTAKLADSSITAAKLGDKMLPVYIVSSDAESVSRTPCLRAVVDASGTLQKLLFDEGGGS